MYKKNSTKLLAWHLNHSAKYTSSLATCVGMTVLLSTFSITSAFAQASPATTVSALTETIKQKPQQPQAVDPCLFQVRCEKSSASHHTGIASSGIPAAALQATTDIPNLMADTVQRARAPESNRGWMHWNYMFGDLGGIRSYLARHGIDFSGHWMNESAGNPVGGRKQDAKSTEHWDINVVADLDKLMGVKGGTFKLNIMNREGGDLSSHVVGNWQTIQQIYGAGQDNRLAEMSYSQYLNDKRWWFAVGYMPVGNYFGREIYGCDFMNVSLCAHPMTLSYDSGWRNNPKASWGFFVRRNFPDAFYFQTGVSQSNPYNGNHDNGFNLSMTGSGVVIPMEFGWEPGKVLNMLPGHYRVGGYYDNSHIPSSYYNVSGLSAGTYGGPFELIKGHHGVYAMFDQMLVSFDHDPNRGVVIWGGMGYSNPDVSAATYEFAGQGSIMLLGPFRSRPHDLIGLAWARLSGNPMHQNYLEDVAHRKGSPFTRATAENLLELDYGVAVTPWLNLRPNIQYIFRPGGENVYHNALALGLDSKVTF
ncbi:carbohydrate porin [Gluconobacter wancherniae]|uniref:carbohydrate porin n=1 Tax=Gluconobacter wancherniae TaxID=1307955 RepID=UPI001B8B5BBE|nr:carbohydrate porin [Gluconobacter wancherniae]MBS1064341.1 carbohydrate porin [Gluconobacter wancherniae]